MKKVLFCCLLFLGIVCIGCQSKDNFDDTTIEEIEIGENEAGENKVGENEAENDTNFSVRGKELLDEGKITEAIEQFNKALEEQEEAWIYGDLGRAKQMNNDLDGAIECFTKAIELNGKSSIYYQWRAEAYRRSNKQDLAEKDQKIADELHAKGMD